MLYKEVSEKPVWMIQLTRAWKSSSELTKQVFRSVFRTYYIICGTQCKIKCSLELLTISRQHSIKASPGISKPAVITNCPGHVAALSVALTDQICHPKPDSFWVQATQPGKQKNHMSLIREKKHSSDILFHFHDVLYKPASQQVQSNTPELNQRSVQKGLGTHLKPLLLHPVIILQLLLQISQIPKLLKINFILLLQFLLNLLIFIHKRWPRTTKWKKKNKTERLTNTQTYSSLKLVFRAPDSILAFSGKPLTGGGSSFF